MNQEEKNKIGEQIIGSLEEKHQGKVFTLRILNDVEDGLEVIVVFEDKQILHGLVSVHMVEDNWACRIRGDYI